MATLKKYNQKAEEIGTVEVSDSIGNTFYNTQLIKNSVVAHLAKKRQGTHKTKGRSEVSGSTRKLYKQKGTGNARVGGIRSPLRRHGGVAFGPVPRSYDKKVNKKERIIAFKSALGHLIQENQIQIVESLELSSHKTKDWATFLNQWKSKSYLILVNEPSQNLIMGTKNIKQVKLLNVNSLNIYDILNFSTILMTEDDLRMLEKRFN